MPIYHDRETLLAVVRGLPDGMLTDGLLIDCPKRRRREQAQNKRPMLIKMAPEHKKRLGVIFNRFIELAGKDMGIELMLRIIERWTDEDIKTAMEGQ